MSEPNVRGTSGPPGAKKTIVEEGSTLKGQLTSTCPIVVRGSVDGEVEAPSVTVESTGVVSGRIKADELKSDGELAGEIHVQRIRLAGVVRDKTVVRAQSLEVKLEVSGSALQVVFGDCALEVGDAPVRKE